MRLLLISNSTSPGGSYLDYPGDQIKDFLGKKRVRALFLPYAAVTFPYEEYEEKVAARFRELGHDIVSVHHYDSPVEAIKTAAAIVIGGGNTWMLIRKIRDNRLQDHIRQRVAEGVPYIGWSAGANVSCPTIMTTNDMPVVEPDSFAALGLIPFQINPHYTDRRLEGHAGETREERILEYIEANPGTRVAGLREGTMLLREGGSLRLIGSGKVRVFRKGDIPREYGASDDLSFLLQ